MRVGPEGKVPKLQRPDSVIERLRIEKVEEQDHHGITIGGCFVSANCNIFLLIMATIFTVGGIIFTVISYRPRDYHESMDHYNDRQESEDGSQTKIVGPIFVLIGLIMLLISLLLHFIFWYIKQEERGRNYELSINQEDLQRSYGVRKSMNECYYYVGVNMLTFEQPK